eukprot:4554965-Amphidinium_carterae.1
MHVACGQRIVVPLAFGSKFGRRTWLSAKVDKLDGLTAKVDKLTETVEGIKTKVNETGARPIQKNTNPPKVCQIDILLLLPAPEVGPR